MMRVKVTAILIMLLAIPVFCVPEHALAEETGTTYYVDSANGDDNNNGTSADTPWKTSKKVNETVFNFREIKSC